MLRSEVLTLLRALALEHALACGPWPGEDQFRRNVCQHTESVQCGERTLAGDAVAKVAQPVASVIDVVSKKLGRPTNLQGCGGCKKRRERLNLWHEKMLKALGTAS